MSWEFILLGAYKTVERASISSELILYEDSQLLHLHILACAGDLTVLLSPPCIIPWGDVGTRNGRFQESAFIQVRQKAQAGDISAPEIVER